MTHNDKNGQTCKKTDYVDFVMKKHVYVGLLLVDIVVIVEVYFEIVYVSTIRNQRMYVFYLN